MRRQRVESGARARREDRCAPLPAAVPRVTMLLPRLCWLPLLAGLLPPAPAQKFSALTVSRPAGTWPARPDSVRAFPCPCARARAAGDPGERGAPSRHGVRAGEARAGPQAAAWASGVSPPRGGALGSCASSGLVGRARRGPRAEDSGAAPRTVRGPPRRGHARPLTAVPPAWGGLGLASLCHLGPAGAQRGPAAACWERSCLSWRPS